MPEATATLTLPAIAHIDFGFFDELLAADGSELDRIVFLAG
jgi:hypothetical protein